jgi:hypothetical protein
LSFHSEQSEEPALAFVIALAMAVALVLLVLFSPVIPEGNLRLHFPLSVLPHSSFPS